MAKQITVTEKKPLGKGKVVLIKGTTEGPQGPVAVELKAWSDAAYIGKLEPGCVVPIEVEERTSEYNGETRKERWIKSADGTPEREQRGGKGGFGGGKPPQKSPAGEASIVVSVMVKSAVEIHNHQQTLAFEAEKFNAEKEARPMKWQPKADIPALKALICGLSEVSEAEVRKLIPLMEAK